MRFCNVMNLHRKELDALVWLFIGQRGVSGLAQKYSDMCNNYCQDGPDDPSDCEMLLLVRFVLLVLATLPRKVREMDIVELRSHSYSGLAQRINEAAEDLNRSTDARQRPQRQATSAVVCTSAAGSCAGEGQRAWERRRRNSNP